MTQETQITVIPAQPGFRAVYDEDGKSLFIADTIIAWRVETVRNEDRSFSSYTSAVTLDGDTTEGCVGVLHPDGRVTLWQDTELENIDAAIEHYQHRSI
jgi:hypothetical protein